MSSAELALGIDAGMSTEKLIQVSDAANTHDLSNQQSITDSVDKIELQAGISPENTTMDDFVGRAQELTGGPKRIEGLETTGSISTLGGATDGGASTSIAKVENQAPPAPSYRELMQNYRDATSYAVEINLVGTAGTSMAGSMGKLMSGQ